MTTILAHCAVCGQLKLAAPVVTVHVVRNSPTRSYYRFDCPTCATTIQNPLHNGDLINQLTTAGCVLEVEVFPLEVLEPHPPRARDSRRPLSLAEVDDLAIDLHAPRLTATADPDELVATLAAEDPHTYARLIRIPRPAAPAASAPPV